MIRTWLTCAFIFLASPNATQSLLVSQHAISLKSRPGIAKSSLFACSVSSIIWLSLHSHERVTDTC